MPKMFSNMGECSSRNIKARAVPTAKTGCSGPLGRTSPAEAAENCRALSPQGGKAASRGWHVTCLSGSTMQAASNYRRWIFLAWLAAAPVFGADLEDPSQLEGLAKSEAQRQLPPLTAKQRFAVGPIDRHVQLEHCGAPVQPIAAPGAHMHDRILIELR